MAFFKKYIINPLYFIVEYLQKTFIVKYLQNLVDLLDNLLINTVITGFVVTLLSVIYSSLGDDIDANGYIFKEIACISAKKHWGCKINSHELEKSSNKQKYFIFVLDRSGSTHDKNIFKNLVGEEKLYFKEFSRDFIKFDSLIEDSIIYQNHINDTIVDKNAESLYIKAFPKLTLRDKVMLIAISSVKNEQGASYSLASWARTTKTSPDLLFTHKSKNETEKWNKLDLNSPNGALNFLQTNTFNAQTSPLDSLLHHINQQLDEIKDPINSEVSIIFISDFDQDAKMSKRKAKYLIDKEIKDILKRDIKIVFNLFQLPALSQKEVKELSEKDSKDITKKDTINLPNSVFSYSRFTNYNSKDFEDVFFNSILEPDYLEYVFSSKIRKEGKVIIIPYEGKFPTEQKIDIPILDSLNLSDSKRFYISLLCENPTYDGFNVKFTNKTNKDSTTILLKPNESGLINLTQNSTMSCKITNRFSKNPETMWLELVPSNNDKENKVRIIHPIYFQRIFPKYLTFYYYLLVLIGFIALVVYGLKVSYAVFRDDMDDDSRGVKGNKAFLNNIYFKISGFLTTLLPLIFLYINLCKDIFIPFFLIAIFTVFPVLFFYNNKTNPKLKDEKEDELNDDEVKIFKRITRYNLLCFIIVGIIISLIIYS